MSTKDTEWEATITGVILLKAFISMVVLCAIALFLDHTTMTNVYLILVSSFATQILIVTFCREEKDGG